MHTLCTRYVHIRFKRVSYSTVGCSVKPANIRTHRWWFKFINILYKLCQINQILLRNLCCIYLLLLLLKKNNFPVFYIFIFIFAVFCQILTASSGLLAKVLLATIITLKWESSFCKFEIMYLFYCWQCTCILGRYIIVFPTFFEGPAY